MAWMVAGVLASSVSNGVAQQQQGEREPTTATEEEIEEVVVTATSRVIRDGYAAPTPVTVLGTEDLEAAGEPTVYQAIYRLPSMANSTASINYSTAQSNPALGLNRLNLRGLGLERTLVLFDGQRVVPGWLTGSANMSAIPEALIERVEVVTGGASASWGSDAVAGVVNYVTDKDFVGFKGDVSGGITDYGDDEHGGLSLAAGTRFAGDRAHIVASGEFFYNAGIVQGIGSRDWYDRTRILQRSIEETPPGEPQLLVRPNVVSSVMAPGGLITSGPLAGIAFGPGGAPYDFQYGSEFGGAYMAGGQQSGDMGANANLDGRLRRSAFYSRISYDLTDTTDIYATMSHGSVYGTGHSFPGEYRPSGLTIQCDNAFLPASIAAACDDNGITDFRLGTFTADFPDNVTEQNRRMWRYTLGASGEFSVFDTEWVWDSYVQRGETRADVRVKNTSLRNLFDLAIDAVRRPDGAIVCRSSLTSPDNGCVPFNVIGTGVASQAALDWVLGTPHLSTSIEQDAFGFSVSGEPFTLWAGPVSVAAGYDYRKESFHQSADPYSEGDGGNPLLRSAGNNWFIGNYHASRGSYRVNEVFLEAVIPLFSEASIGNTELSLAGRATDYTTSGNVNTWKVGLTYSPAFSNGLRFRALRSRDIRAPNLLEGFAAPVSFTGFVIDRFAPYAGQEFSIQRPTVGNPFLDPEQGLTTQFGVVLQPEWLPGFSAAVDYWRISVTDAIGTILPQQVMDLCFQGNQTLCDQIERNDIGQPVFMTLRPINLASKKAEGLDIEVTYQTDMAELIAGVPGELALRMLATHNIRHEDISGIPNAPAVERAGTNGLYTTAIPSWNWRFTQSYTTDRFRLSLSERYISSGVINNNYVECTSNCPVPTFANPTIDDNQIDGVLYLDVGGSYAFGDRGSELYFQIDNATNVDPPTTPLLATGIAFIGRSVNPWVYDTLGRTYRLGFRFSF